MISLTRNWKTFKHYQIINPTMGSSSNLIEYVPDKNSHFYLCQCKTSIGLNEDLLLTDTIHLVIVLENVVNVKFSDSHLRITECEIQNIHCAKCGVRLGYKVATPRTIPHHNDEPLVVFWLDWTKVVEWNGNEILGAHSAMSRIGIERTLINYDTTQDDDLLATAIAEPYRHATIEMMVQM